MAKLKDLVGHINVRSAGQARDCRHNRKHRIQKGEIILEVTTGPFKSPRGYCRGCSLEMVRQAKASVLQWEDQLNG